MVKNSWQNSKMFKKIIKLLNRDVTVTLRSIFNFKMLLLILFSFVVKTTVNELIIGKTSYFRHHHQLEAHCSEPSCHNCPILIGWQRSGQSKDHGIEISIRGGWTPVAKHMFLADLEGADSLSSHRSANKKLRRTLIDRFKTLCIMLPLLSVTSP